MKAAADQQLDTITIETDSRTTCAIVAVSGGYPGDYEKGKTIHGLEKSAEALVFHAGTKKISNHVVTDGGRVLAITGRGNSLEEARNAAYTCASHIKWDGLYFRKDVGVDLMNYKG